MSRKNDYLLHRNGKNQFGDYDQDSPIPPLTPVTDRDQVMWVMHRELNDAFVRDHGATWLALFENLSMKDAWVKLCPHGVPALSTFRIVVKEYANFEEFLFYWMLSHKRSSLELLGLSKVDIDAVFENFIECGRYYVSYGRGKRTFGTL